MFFFVVLNMKQFIFIYLFFFSSYVISQEQYELNDNESFFGYWSSNDSNYYLQIKNTDDNFYFMTYKFLPSIDEEGYLDWARKLSPGQESFIKKEYNRIVTNYWIEDQDYYVTVTYTMMTPTDLKAEFNGKHKGKPYYNIINYKKVSIN